MSSVVQPGAPAPLSFTVPDGDPGKFPQARVFSFPGGSEDSNSPVDLVHLVEGTYVGSWAVPESGDFFVVNFIAYDDAGHTTPTVGVDRKEEVLTVNRESRIQIGGTLDRSVSPAQFRVNAWVERNGVVISAGLANAVLNLYDKDGADLLGGSPISAASPDAQGVFLFEFDEPGFAVGQSQAYMHVALEDSSVVRSGVSSVSVLRRA